MNSLQYIYFNKWIKLQLYFHTKQNKPRIFVILFLKKASIEIWRVFLFYFKEFYLTYYLWFSSLLWKAIKSYKKPSCIKTLLAITPAIASLLVHFIQETFTRNTSLSTLVFAQLRMSAKWIFPVTCSHLYLQHTAADCPDFMPNEG